MIASLKFPPRNIAAWPAKLAFYLRVRRENLRRWTYRQAVWFQNRGTARYSVLWDNPPVIYAPLAEETARLLPLPGNALVLLALYHSAEADVHLRFIQDHLTRWQTLCPQVRFVVLANTAREVELLAALGFEVRLVNHNAFIDTNAFTIKPEIEPRFDAIYDAQLLPYKRHYLATEIARLALISYMNRPSPDVAYARSIRRTLGAATWLNDPLAPDYRRLPVSEICSALNASRCGLCLSDAEGAMYASTQYLLCGIPVVTTPNIGGRDYFFEDTFVATVEPTPAAIAAGVDRFVRHPVDRPTIRRQTLAKVEALRAHFIALVQEHLDRYAPGSDFSARFQREFFHTLVRNQKPRRFAPMRS